MEHLGGLGHSGGRDSAAAAEKRPRKRLMCALWGRGRQLRLDLRRYSLESALSLIPSARDGQPGDRVRARNRRLNPGVCGHQPCRETRCCNRPLPRPPQQSVNPLQIWTLIAAWVVARRPRPPLLIYAQRKLFEKLRRKGRGVAPGQATMSESATRSTRRLFWASSGQKSICPRAWTRRRGPSVIAHETAHLRRGDNLWKTAGLSAARGLLVPAAVLAGVYSFVPRYRAGLRRAGRPHDGPGRGDRLFPGAARLQRPARSKIAACPLAFGEVGVKERVKKIS
jgi:hypothetical protein